MDPFWELVDHIASIAKTVEMVTIEYVIENSVLPSTVAGIADQYRIYKGIEIVESEQNEAAIMIANDVVINVNELNKK